MNTVHGEPAVPVVMDPDFRQDDGRVQAAPAGKTGARERLPLQ